MHSLQRPAKAKGQRRSLWAGLRTRTSTGTDTSLIFAKPRSLLALSLGAPEPLLKQRKIEGHQVVSPAVGTGAECATRPARPRPRRWRRGDKPFINNYSIPTRMRAGQRRSLRRRPVYTVPLPPEVDGGRCHHVLLATRQVELRRLVATTQPTHRHELAALPIGSGGARNRMGRAWRGSSRTCF